MNAASGERKARLAETLNASSPPTVTSEAELDAALVAGAKGLAEAGFQDLFDVFGFVLKQFLHSDLPPGRRCLVRKPEFGQIARHTYVRTKNVSKGQL